MVRLTHHVRTPKGWNGHCSPDRHENPEEPRTAPSPVHRPNGETNRKPQIITAKRPGQMMHVDIKQAGKIHDGGRWRVHGRGSA
jgi:hypothetical protein